MIETFLLSSFRKVDKFLGLNGNVMQLISYIKLLSGNLLDLLNDIIPETFLWLVEKNKDNNNKRLPIIKNKKNIDIDKNKTIKFNQFQY